uniref:Uncharacterized protein n=2 Tax=Lutzomyia longipalpis TaxID=7200 RepID=A0A1B0CLP8_LUTLO
MRYQLRTCRLIDIIKWVMDRDWRDIERVLGAYIEEGKYKTVQHSEILHVEGDIQLKVRTVLCPEYLSRIFEGDAGPSTTVGSTRCQGSYHSTQLEVIVKFGALKKANEEAPGKTKKETEVPEKKTDEEKDLKTDKEPPKEPKNEGESTMGDGCFVVTSSLCTPTKEEEGNLAVCRTGVMVRRRPQTPWPHATSTPFPADDPYKFDEELPSEIIEPSSITKATKRKRQEQVTPDLVLDSSDSEAGDPLAGTEKKHTNTVIDLLTQSTTGDPTEGPSGIVETCKKAKCVEAESTSTEAPLPNGRSLRPRRNINLFTQCSPGDPMEGPSGVATAPNTKPPVTTHNNSDSDLEEVPLVLKPGAGERKPNTSLDNWIISPPRSTKKPRKRVVRKKKKVEEKVPRRSKKFLLNQFSSDSSDQEELPPRKTCRLIDVIKVEEKLLAVQYEFTPRHGVQKWVMDRDWRDIERVLGAYIEEGKYKTVQHSEILHVEGDIQLKVRTVQCPEYLSRIFEGDAGPSTTVGSTRCQGSYHSTQLEVIVKFGALKKANEEAPGKTKKETEVPEKKTDGEKDVKTDKETQKELKNEGESSMGDGCFVVTSSLCTPTKEEEGNLAVCRTGVMVRRRPQTPWPHATSTPFPADDPYKFDEELPSEIIEPSSITKATKRKRQEQVTPDLVLDSSDSEAGDPLAGTEKKHTNTVIDLLTQSTTGDPTEGPSGTVEMCKKAKCVEAESTSTEAPLPNGRSLRPRRNINLFTQCSPGDPMEGPSGAATAPDTKPPVATHNNSDSDLEEVPVVLKPGAGERKPNTSLDNWVIRTDEQRRQLTKAERLKELQIISPPRSTKKPRKRVVRKKKKVEEKVPRRSKKFLLNQFSSDSSDQEELPPRKYAENLAKETVDYGKLSQMVLQYVLAEWIMHVFMAEHNMTRAEAIAYLIEREKKDKNMNTDF